MRAPTNSLIHIINQGLAEVLENLDQLLPDAVAGGSAARVHAQIHQEPQTESLAHRRGREGQQTGEPGLNRDW